MSEDYNAEVAASTCMEYGTDCYGTVEFCKIGSSLFAWPRCRYHAKKLEKTLNSAKAADLKITENNNEV